MDRGERMQFFKKLDRQFWTGPKWLERRQGAGNNIIENQKFIGKNSRNDFINIFFFFLIIRNKAQSSFLVYHNRTAGKIEVTPEFLEKNYTEENIAEIWIVRDLTKTPQKLYQQIQ